MDRTSPVDGFRLAYERTGSGTAVVLLHGWPGDRTDYREVVPLLPEADVVVICQQRRRYPTRDAYRLSHRQATSRS